MTTNLYNINVYDHSGALVINLKQWDRLEFTLRLNAPDSHSIQLRASRNTQYSNLLRRLQRDYFIVITKIDPLDFQHYTVYEGFHNTVTEQMQKSGELFFNLYGSGYTKLLDRRLVIPTAGQETNDKNGLGETIMKSYVTESCVNPTDSNRKMPGFVVATSQSRGNTVEYSARYTNLLSVCERIAEDGNLDFGVVRGETLGEFVFDARPLWGVDRGSGSGVVTPLVFSLEHGNIDIPILSTNSRHEKNYMFVGGDGRGEDRIIFEYGDTEALSRTPWSRSELWVDARKETDISALRAIAKQTVEERGRQITLDFDTIQTIHTRWPRDWNIGDIVSAKYGGFEFDIKVEEVTINLTAGESAQATESIAVELA